MINRKQTITIAMLLIDLVLIFIIMWLGDIMQWSIWVRQLLIALLFFINIAFYRKYHL